MDIDLFDTPKEFGMTVEETTAYKLAVFWMEKVKQYFPHVRHAGNKLSKGDPRKSFLFKCCMKMVRETRGLLAPEDYEQYIIAQLYVFKKNSEEDGVTCLLTPLMLAPPKGLRRWGLYKSLLKRLENTRVEDNTHFNIDHIRSELLHTQKYLLKVTKEVTPAFLKARFDKGEIDQWVNFGFIRPYFVALSPTLNALGTPAQELPGLDAPEVIALFRSCFPKDQ